MARNGSPTPMSKQKALSEDELLALRSHLEDWNRTAGRERRQILKAAIAEALLLAPRMESHLKKLRKDVSISQSIPSAIDSLGKTYKQWFYNHGQRKRTPKELIKYGKKWTWRKVIEVQKKDQILQHTGAKPGEKKMIGNYQHAMKIVLDGLTQEEKDAAKETAKEWAKAAPPPEVQAKTAKSKADSMIRQFATQMYKEAGMRVFILSAWKDGDGKLMIGG